MIVLTGWSSQVLAAQPPDVIRRLAWRVYAGALWRLSVGHREVASTVIPRDTPIMDRIRVSEPIQKARAAVAHIDAELFPEGDDVG